MNKESYLSQKVIQEFISWTLPKINTPDQFKHKYFNLRSKTNWSCNSVYNAFENYEWRFNCTIPHHGKIKGLKYYESSFALEQIKNGLRHAVENKNPKEAFEYSVSVLEWGGVKRSNYEKLLSMDRDIINYYNTMKSKINPKSVNIDHDLSDVIMNSGFTKIYSLLIDDFIIYDSRVGAALGILTKNFLTEYNIPEIPMELDFAYGNSRPTKNDKSKTNKRDPGNGTYKFSVLRNNDHHHTINNIKGNWLVKALADRSIFNQEQDPIRALEAALFMIGYAVNE